MARRVKKQLVATVTCSALGNSTVARAQSRSRGIRRPAAFVQHKAERLGVGPGTAERHLKHRIRRRAWECRKRSAWRERVWQIGDGQLRASEGQRLIRVGRISGKDPSRFTSMA